MSQGALAHRPTATIAAYLSRAGAGGQARFRLAHAGNSPACLFHVILVQVDMFIGEMMRKFKNNRLSPRAIMALFFFLALPNAPGWTDDSEHPIAIGAAAATPIETSGLRGYRDPQSGRFGAPPARVTPPGLSIAEQQQLNRSDRGLRARSLPNGAVAIDLQGRFRSMAVAATDASGKPAVNCTVTPTEATKVFQSAVRTKTTEQ